MATGRRLKRRRARTHAGERDLCVDGVVTGVRRHVGRSGQGPTDPPSEMAGEQHTTMAVQGEAEMMQLTSGQRVEVWYVPPSPTGVDQMSSRRAG